MYSKRLPAKYCYWLLFLLTSFDSTAFSQDSLFQYKYDSRLYNGLEYIRSGIPANGTPFFDTDSLRPGILCYNGLLFKHVPMEYDLVTDQLVIPYSDSYSFVSLISEKLSYFSIGSQRFLYIDPGKKATALLTTGFYQELYHNGSTRVLARRKKELIFPSNRDDQPRYVQHNTYFLVLDDQYFPIESEKDLLEITKDKKNAVKQYIRKNNIRFKKNLQDALVRTTDFYLQIRH